MIFLPLLLSAFLLHAPAAVAAPMPLPAVAASPKEAERALLTLRTYDRVGKPLGEGNAFFVSADGEAVAPYSLLLGAARAEVTDWKGNRHALSRVTGGNSAADVVKFTTEGVRKAAFLPLAAEPAAEGAQLLLAAPSADKKKRPPQPFAVMAVEPYGDLKYYNVSTPNEERFFGCPLLNEAGEAVAIVQRNVGKNAAGACALDARFVSRLTITATSSLNSDLRALALPKALPGNPKDALTFLYMTPAADSLNKALACDDFIARWPNMPEGYVQRGTLRAAAGRYADCDNDFSTAAKLAEIASADTLMKSDAVHYAWSELIYRTLTARADTAAVSPSWTLRRACEEAGTAYARQPYTLYLQQQGNCLFSMKRYGEAFGCFEKVTRDKSFATPSAYFAAARSLELSGADTARVMAWMDSTVNAIAKPCSARDAQYYLERCQRLLRGGQYRRAVADYNEYEKAVGPKNLNERFYYLRGQAETEARMYQQALDDIRTAIALAPSPLPYRLEEALLLLRVGEFDDAAAKASALLRDLPESPDCYKIIGVAAGERGKKAAALQNLQKARDLGDESVGIFIEKYKKLK